MLLHLSFNQCLLALVVISTKRQNLLQTVCINSLLMLVLHLRHSLLMLVLHLGEGGAQ